MTEKLKQASPNSQYRSHAIDLEKPTEEEWADLEKDLDSLPGHVTVCAVSSINVADLEDPREQCWLLAPPLRAVRGTGVLER